MATQVDAARLLTLRAARLKDAGERIDLEAGMAKLFASETGRFCVEESLRIHGGYGYSKEYEIERLYRDAPLLLIGEGTSEIQRMVIGRKLLSGTRSNRATSPAPCRFNDRSDRARHARGPENPMVRSSGLELVAGRFHGRYRRGGHRSGGRGDADG